MAYAWLNRKEGGRVFELIFFLSFPKTCLSNFDLLTDTFLYLTNSSTSSLPHLHHVDVLPTLATFLCICFQAFTSLNLMGGTLARLCNGVFGKIYTLII